MHAVNCKLTASAEKKKKTKKHKPKDATNHSSHSGECALECNEGLPQKGLTPKEIDFARLLLKLCPD